MINIETYFFNTLGNSHNLNEELSSKLKPIESASPSQREIVKNLVNPLEVKTIEDIVTHSDKFFISIEDEKRMAHFSEWIKDDYLEGAIKITIDYRSIIGFKEYDLVDQLWIALLAMTHEYLLDGTGIAYWPDQPTELNLSSVSEGKLLLKLLPKDRKTVSTTVSKIPFINAVCDSGNQFFKFLAPYKPPMSKDGLRIIQDIRLLIKPI